MSNWVQKDAAELLAISPRVMNYKIKTLGIDFPRGRRAALQHHDARGLGPATGGLAGPSVARVRCSGRPTLRRALQLRHADLLPADRAVCLAFRTVTSHRGRLHDCRGVDERVSPDFRTSSSIPAIDEDIALALTDDLERDAALTAGVRRRPRTAAQRRRRRRRARASVAAAPNRLPWRGRAWRRAPACRSCRGVTNLVAWEARRR